MPAMEYQPLPDLQEPPGRSLPPSRTIPLQPPSSPANRKARRRRWIFWLGLPLATIILAVATGVGVAASIQRPEVEKELADFVPRLVTSLYDRTGQPFRTYQRENRVLLEEGDVPELLQNAIISAEDSEFFRHGGIDLPGIVRAVLANYRAGRKVQGASTITMQLARELFLTREKSWKRKIEEAFLAVELEKQFSKQQLLTLYCNLVNLGHGNYGMEAAARDYFNKSVGDLTLVEAATLAGIPQRPTDLSPYRNPDRVIVRRNHVLRRMADEGFITEEELAQATAEPLLVTARHREVEIGPYFSEEVRRFLAEHYGTNALYDQGLQVSTTLDRDIQRAAEAALRQGLLELDHFKGWRGPTLHSPTTTSKVKSCRRGRTLRSCRARGRKASCSTATASAR
ncbi:MAG: hypothetical protein HC897_03055 [Thermoanaerobaculia bacterium]|nr:hypothetical protein [Thermoanaerobaculia bacterium]